MENAFLTLINELGDQPEREGLVGTPKRAAKALNDLTAGYKQDLDTLINGAVYEATSQDMVIIKDIEIYSLCEHHMLPFLGKCHVGYIPNKKIIGLSKIPRIIEMYARRLQVQEGLTQQIADAIQHSIDPEGVAVTIEAAHLCMRMRGIGKQHSTMVTSVTLGSFRDDPSTRSEYLSLIKK